MNRIIVLSFLGIIGLSSGLELPTKKQGTVEILRPSFDSWHVPTNIKSYLKLSPSDLKLFSGHAIATLRSKCPAVSSNKLFQIQKYLSKVLVNDVQATEGARSNNPNLDKLLESMVTCAKTLEHPPSVGKAPRQPPRTLDFMLSNPGRQAIASVDQANPQKQVVPAERSRPVQIDFDNSKQETTVKPTANTKPESKTLKWIRTFFDDVKSFFSRTLSHVFRRRRSTELDAEELPKPSSVVSLPQAKESLQRFIDEICRVFCMKCQAHTDVMTLKMSVAELRTYILKDENVVLALSALIDDSFLESLQSCGPSFMDELELIR